MDELKNLIERFQEDIDSYRSAGYGEAELRREFLDPLFRILGWDMENAAGRSASTKEILYEGSIVTPDGIKVPDYCFRIGGIRKFFAEAKKPFVNILKDPTPAFQLRRYAWSSGLPISLLTDFEEFAIYDCTIPPKPGDAAHVSRLLYFTVDELEENWDDLSSLFGRSAVLAGSIDELAEKARLAAKRITVDDAFLDELEGWRATLAQHIAPKNPSLGHHELNIAVQLIIDRILFLRIAEDRRIEPYGKLRDAASSAKVYQALIALFKSADERFNSGLFHFRKERDRPTEPDSLTPDLEIGNEPLRHILDAIYYPKSPYEFSVLPPELLGQVYEQFLGKTVIVDNKRRVTVEEKPELRKAGGIYYTPSFVSRYIARGALESRLEGKKPRDIASLKLLDPACGSGSFLLAAYQVLLDWHLDYYTSHDPAKFAKGKNAKLREVSGRGWALTVEERKRILLNNIFGVDIDSQAVEVTKLSLLLKVLEGESEETVGQSYELFKQRALPDLDSNIKCGNTLIDSSYYADEQLALLNEDELLEINAFDWKNEFSELFGRKEPGFDVIIGNPPYRRELDYKQLLDQISKTPFGEKYRAPRMDLWYYFVHRSLELLRPRGTLSFIVNSYFTSGTGAQKLIAALENETAVEELFLLGGMKIFRKVSGSHLIFRLRKERSRKKTRIRIPKSALQASPAVYFLDDGTTETYTKSRSQLFREGKLDVEPPDSLLARIEKHPKITCHGKWRQGIAENPQKINKKTNLKYGSRWTVGEGVFALSSHELKGLSLTKLERTVIKPYYDLVDLGRFFIADKPSLHLIYSTRESIPSISAVPKIDAHLSRFRPIMEKRRETQLGRNKWWHLHWPRDSRIFEGEKIIALQMAPRPAFVLSKDRAYTTFSTNVFVPNEDCHLDLRYITAVLNSKTLWNWFQHTAKKRGVGLELNGNVLERAPVPIVDLDVPAEKTAYRKILNLVDQLQAAAQKLHITKAGHAKDLLVRRFRDADQKLEVLVAQLYGLSSAELAKIDAALSK